MVATNAADLAKGSLHRAKAVDHVFPLEKSFSNAMGQVRGVAIHATAGRSKLEIHKGDWDARGVSAHFVVDREGWIAQYVSLNRQAWAHGPANPTWLSIELTAVPTATGGDEMTDEQMVWTATLVRELADRYRFPCEVATPYVGTHPLMGPGISKHFEKASQDIAFLVGSQAKTREEAAKSTGISCHIWLHEKLGSCPGLPILNQLPDLARKAASL